MKSSVEPFAFKKGRAHGADLSMLQAGFSASKLRQAQDIAVRIAEPRDAN